MGEPDMPTFITLGPSGTCHENALRRYLDFQGLPDSSVVLVEDFPRGLELVREAENAFLIQCSAHPEVHIMTERYRQEVYVIDTFLYPAKEMALLIRVDATSPSRLGVVPAARGYIDSSEWEIVDEPANPVVAKHLLAGRYGAGVTLLEYATAFPEVLKVRERFGEVDTTWLVYGKQRRFAGELIGNRLPSVYWGMAGARDDGRDEADV